MWHEQRSNLVLQEGVHTSAYKVVHQEGGQEGLICQGVHVLWAGGRVGRWWSMRVVAGRQMGATE